MKLFKMNLWKLPLAFLLITFLMPSLTSAQSADEIMKKVDFAARKSFKTQIASVKFTTCKYKVVKGELKCSEKPRIVVAENVKKIKIVNGLFNDRSLSVVRDPARDRGMSLLVYEYGDRSRDNDNWLYLPALAKVNRIIANDDEGGSIFGTEFSVESTENPEGRKIYEYNYEILDETTLRGRPVWVIEMLPTSEKARKTKYSKIEAWIDKKTYLALKEDLYRKGKVYKRRTQSDIRRIDGIYAVMKVVMNNLATSRLSQMDKLAMRHNTKVPDEFVTQRSLTDFAFRERNLTKFRAQLSK
jgi:hypothetical protein